MPNCSQRLPSTGWSAELNMITIVCFSSASCFERPHKAEAVHRGHVHVGDQQPMKRAPTGGPPGACGVLPERLAARVGSVYRNCGGFPPGSGGSSDCRRPPARGRRGASPLHDGETERQIFGGPEPGGEVGRRLPRPSSLSRPDLAPHQLREPSGDGQPQAGAAKAPGGAGVACSNAAKIQGIACLEESPVRVPHREMQDRIPDPPGTRGPLPGRPRPAR